MPGKYMPVNGQSSGLGKVHKIISFGKIITAVTFYIGAMFHLIFGSHPVELRFNQCRISSIILE